MYAITFNNNPTLSRYMEEKPGKTQQNVCLTHNLLAIGYSGTHVIKAMFRH